MRCFFFVFFSKFSADFQKKRAILWTFTGYFKTLFPLCNFVFIVTIAIIISFIYSITASNSNILVLGEHFFCTDCVILRHYIIGNQILLYIVEFSAYINNFILMCVYLLDCWKIILNHFLFIVPIGNKWFCWNITCEMNFPDSSHWNHENFYHTP